MGYCKEEAEYFVLYDPFNDRHFLIQAADEENAKSRYMFCYYKDEKYNKVMGVFESIDVERFPFTGMTRIDDFIF